MEPLIKYFGTWKHMEIVSTVKTEYPTSQNAKLQHKILGSFDATKQTWNIARCNLELLLYEEFLSKAGKQELRSWIQLAVQLFHTVWTPPAHTHTHSMYGTLDSLI